MNETFQGYFSIIPARVRKDEELTANAKLLFGEISSLAQAEGYCYAANSHFARMLGISERTVRRLLDELAGRGHIVREIVRSEATGQVLGRKIFPWWNPPAIPQAGETEIVIADTSDGESSPSDCTNFDNLDCGKNDVQGVTECHVSPQDKNGHWPVVKNGHPSGQKWPLENNVEYINNNKKIPPIVPQKESAKKGSEAQARSELKEWACNCVSAGLTEEGKQDLIEALMAFCDMRAEKRKPLRSGRSVTLLENRLVRYSDNEPGLMIALLDEAVMHQWDSVYPLRDGSTPQSDGEGQKEETKWV